MILINGYCRLTHNGYVEPCENREGAIGVFTSNIDQDGYCRIMLFDRRDQFVIRPRLMLECGAYSDYPHQLVH